MSGTAFISRLQCFGYDAFMRQSENDFHFISEELS